MDKHLVRVKEGGEIKYVERPYREQSNAVSSIKYAAKVIGLTGGVFVNDKPFIIVEHGDWVRDYLAYRSLFGLLPQGVDLTSLEVPAGQAIAPENGSTKLLIIEKMVY